MNTLPLPRVRQTLLLGALLASLGAISAQAAPASYRIDPEHLSIAFSYWHFEQQNLKFSSVDTFLYPYGFKVYLQETEQTDEKLESLNLQIRDSDNRQLSPELYDVNRDPTVSVLKHIYETRLTFEQCIGIMQRCLLRKRMHSAYRLGRIIQSLSCLSAGFRQSLTHWWRS